MRFCGAEYHCLSQSSDGARGFKLRLGVYRTAENRYTACILPREIFCADAAGGPGPQFIDGTVLKKNQRRAGFDAVKNNLLMMDATI